MILYSMPPDSPFDCVSVFVCQSVSSLLIYVEWVSVCVVPLSLYPLPGLPGIWSAASWGEGNQTPYYLLYYELVLVLLSSSLSSTDKHTSILMLISISSTLSSAVSI